MIRGAYVWGAFGGTAVASAALVILGILLVVLGVFFANGNLWLIVIGLLAVFGGGVLQLAMSRRT